MYTYEYDINQGQITFTFHKRLIKAGQKNYLANS